MAMAPEGWRCMTKPVSDNRRDNASSSVRLPFTPAVRMSLMASPDTIRATPVCLLNVFNALLRSPAGMLKDSAATAPIHAMAQAPPSSAARKSLALIIRSPLGCSACDDDGVSAAVDAEVEDFLGDVDERAQILFRKGADNFQLGHGL